MKRQQILIKIHKAHADLKALVGDSATEEWSDGVEEFYSMMLAEFRKTNHTVLFTVRCKQDIYVDNQVIYYEDDEVHVIDVSAGQFLLEGDTVYRYPDQFENLR